MPGQERREGRKDTGEKGGSREVVRAGLEQRDTHASADAQKKTQGGYPFKASSDDGGAHARGVKTET